MPIVRCIAVDISPSGSLSPAVEIERKNIAEFNNRIEAFSLTDLAVRLQLAEDGGELDEGEECLTRALELDSENIEVLQEAAHFYDAGLPHPQKARQCAVQCRAKAAR
jgi:hypothetical protein